ncbi:uncharacterized protein [Dermacentor albipictus]|uniref:uncharacterized protein n=1 Tax=Dermacentor albipictus TaxID=60249 RepID=UPI0038FC87FD
MEPRNGSCREQGRKRTHSASPGPLNFTRRRNVDGPIDWRWLEENLGLFQEPAPGDRSTGKNSAEIVDLEAPSTSHGKGRLWTAQCPTTKKATERPVGVATPFLLPWSLMDRFAPVLKGISAGNSSWHRCSAVNREGAVPVPNVSAAQATARSEEAQEDQPGPSNISQQYR